MGPEELEELSQRIIEGAKASTDVGSLEKELLTVIDDFTERFPERGRAAALHEATSFLFNNNARHFSFFPSFALMAYEALSEISKWYDASVIAEHMTGYQIELLTNQQGNERDLKKWFNLWANSVNGWCEISVDEQSWPGWGTGILNRCEQFSIIPSIQQEVYEFWDSLIGKYGAFEPTPETLERHRKELIDMSQMTASEMDYHQLLKVVFSNRVRLLEKLNVGDLVDLMNRMIELAPKPITDEEIEIEMRNINSNEDISRVCRLSNDLATRLRVGGKINEGIKVLSSAVAREEFDIRYDIMAYSCLKLAIYLDEVGRTDEAEPLFKQVAEEEPGLDNNLITLMTVRDACHRYSTLLLNLGRIAESKEYLIRENNLSETMGDPFSFVRSCFNIAADCNDLDQEKEALEWFMLGMMNIRDGCGIEGNPQTPPPFQEQLIEISRSLAVVMGIEDRWGMMMQHIFADNETTNGN
tara:strand:- start:2887 stop:4299 length:1413 start_codon:yes stop_codon:yes gene_type:complete